MYSEAYYLSYKRDLEKYNGDPTKGKTCIINFVETYNALRRNVKDMEKKCIKKITEIMFIA